MRKNQSGKLTLSTKYGAAVQLYHKANGDITFYACYLDYTKLDKNGKPLRQRVKIGNQSEGITQGYVKIKRDELATKARLGEVPESVKNRQRRETTTLQNLADLYFEMLVARNDNVVNINKAKSVFKNHLMIFAFRTAEDIEDEEIKTLSDMLLREKHRAESTVNNALILLNAIFNFGIREKHIRTRPLITKIRGVENKRERFFDALEIAQILEHVKDQPALDLFVRLSLSTGGRLETIRMIQVKDINLSTNTISLVDIKRKSARHENSRYTGFFNNNLKNYLSGIIKDKAPDDYLLSDSFGKLVSRDYIQNNLKRLFDKLFNNNLSTRDAKYRAVVHTLRHTFASQLAINNVPIYRIQKLMNHADPHMTARYAKLLPDFGLEAIEKLGFL